MFKRLYDWTLANQSRFGQSGFTFSLVWLWVMLVLMIQNLTAINNAVSAKALLDSLHDQLVPFYDKFDASITGSFGMMLLTTCIAAPLVEEAFRAGLCEICADEQGNVRYRFLLIAISCFLFGLLHGGGYFSILVQGSLGLLLARLWFRTNKNADGTVAIIWPYFCNVFVHAAYNFGILGIKLFVVRGQL